MTAPNVPAVLPKGFLKGYDPRRSLNGGRPRKVVELEKILDEHREPDMLRATLDRLRELAFGEPIDIKDREGNVIEVQLRAHPGFMKLYLDRLIGPVSDDNSETVHRLAQELLDGMLEAARARRQAAGG